LLEPHAQAEIEKILADEMNFGIPLSVPVAEALRKPHHLVEQTRTALKGSKPNDYGVLWRRRGVLDLRVSPACLGRALRIYDALIKSMEALGWTVTLGGRDQDETYVTIRGEEIRFAVEEHIKQTEHVLTPKEEHKKVRWPNSHTRRWDYHPTGELNVRIKEYSGDRRRRRKKGKTSTPSYNLSPIRHSRGVMIV
jgi:hypothetical protein